MNATPSSNNRFMIILIAVLILLLPLLAVNVVRWISLIGGGMMMEGMMNHQDIQACINMMQNPSK